MLNTTTVQSVFILYITTAGNDTQILTHHGQVIRYPKPPSEAGYFFHIRLRYLLKTTSVVTSLVIR